MKATSTLPSAFLSALTVIALLLAWYDHLYTVPTGREVAGSVIFAPPGLPHRFHSITEDLRLLVFFAPAEGTANAVDKQRR